ncbi:uncharacterized protein EV154DRAFT_577673 [Mucor mucedo]|uniref:uncharacterized protein n=1 Tax=Mucor mucedo TaxID=29922 RepID=UPI00221F0639|nr:uncharacterized protein EV154DRAFT_577673 [Mucor mucedo]KAI7875847.1 hypothetical protein EV154DRAFT_577673 [Mucor mucedo]
MDEQHFEQVGSLFHNDLQKKPNEALEILKRLMTRAGFIIGKQGETTLLGGFSHHCVVFDGEPLPVMTTLNDNVTLAVDSGILTLSVPAAASAATTASAAEAETTTASTAAAATKTQTTTTAASDRAPAARGSTVVEEVQAAVDAASRLTAEAATASASEIPDQAYDDLRSKMVIRLEKNNTRAYLTTLTERAEELNNLVNQIGIGDAFRRSLGSADIKEFTGGITQIEKTITFKNLPVKRKTRWFEMVFHQLHFMSKKSGGERVMRLYGMLGMKGILAVEIITIT